MVEGKKVPVLPKKQEKKLVLQRSNYKENSSDPFNMMEEKDLNLNLPKSEQNLQKSVTIDEVPDNKSTISKKSSLTNSKLGFGSSSKK